MPEEESVGLFQTTMDFLIVTNQEKLSQCTGQTDQAFAKQHIEAQPVIKIDLSKHTPDTIPSLLDESIVYQHLKIIGDTKSYLSLYQGYQEMRLLTTLLQALGDVKAKSLQLSIGTRADRVFPPVPIAMDHITPPRTNTHIKRLKFVNTPEELVNLFFSIISVPAIICKLGCQPKCPDDTHVNSLELEYTYDAPRGCVVSIGLQEKHKLDAYTGIGFVGTRPVARLSIKVLNPEFHQTLLDLLPHFILSHRYRELVLPSSGLLEIYQLPQFSEVEAASISVENVHYTDLWAGGALTPPKYQNKHVAWCTLFFRYRGLYTPTDLNKIFYNMNNLFPNIKDVHFCIESDSLLWASLKSWDMVGLVWPKRPRAFFYNIDTDVCEQIVPSKPGTLSAPTAAATSLTSQQNTSPPKAGWAIENLLVPSAPEHPQPDQLATTSSDLSPHPNTNHPSQPPRTQCWPEDTNTSPPRTLNLPIPPQSRWRKCKRAISRKLTQIERNQYFQIIYVSLARVLEGFNND
ncbi:hypothetical protein NEDG_01886 [Nematocida displodere]|uniref:Uncharacterized protein n=1 Tax=Nematocida displodere TaxID=1805483 RepID=A0A177EJ07_9MICR|nr:hypothetical protein NEDG_01886 [Nematocida displodere]